VNLYEIENQLGFREKNLPVMVIIDGRPHPVVAAYENVAKGTIELEVKKP